MAATTTAAQETWTVAQQAVVCTPATDKHELRRRRLRKLKTCCQSSLSFLFSHIGLSAVVVAYTIMGGFLFQWLEAPNESRVRTDMGTRKNATVLEIVELAQELLNQTENLTEKVLVLVSKYESDVIQAVNEHGFDGNKVDGLKWTFAGALLFAVTVTTTIGYGHVAPKTSAGRVVTILYALIGIPLTFLCLANIGDFLADCFRLFYAKICCGLCCILWSKPKKKRQKIEVKTTRKRPTNEENQEKKKKKGKKKEKKAKSDNRSESRESLHTDTSLLDQSEFDPVEEPNQDMDEKFYSTLDIFQDYKESTLSLADTKIHLKDDDVMICVQDLFQAKETDITGFTSTNTPTGDQIQELPQINPETTSIDMGGSDSKLKRKWSSRRKRNRRKDKRWKSDTAALFGELNQVPGLQRPRGRDRAIERSDSDRFTTSQGDLMEMDVELKRVKSGEEKVRVPITVCLLLIFLYIVAGAFLFAKWEDWDYLTGSYFCFVTLSTIGFGDIVPGTTLGVAGDEDGGSAQEKLVACAMYLAMGLSVLAMCFNLMQEEVKEKFRWLAKKIGIMSSDEDST